MSREEGYTLCTEVMDKNARIPANTVLGIYEQHVRSFMVRKLGGTLPFTSSIDSL